MHGATRESRASCSGSATAILTNRDGDESVVVPVEMGMVEFEVGVKPVFVEIADSEQQGNQ